VLVEREFFVAALTALLDEAAGGDGRLVFLGGEAGVGKTALASALAEAAAGRVAIRRGGCDNLTTAAALGPIVEAVPELADVLEGDAGVDRLQLFRRLRSELSAGPCLLLLEDVHWADEATLDLLRVLGRRLTGLPVLVVASFREDEVSRSHPMTVVLGDLATQSGVVRMQVPPLTLAGVQQLVAGAGSSLDPVQLHRNTGGNPFYVTEVLAAGDERLPATVRDAVLARAQRLPPAAQRVLSAAAVLGPRIELSLLATVSGEPPAAVDECVHHGVLVADGAVLAFRHELGRLAIEQTLSPGQRVALHAAALRALRAAGEPDDRRLVHHAVGCGDGAAVLDHAPQAAARAARLGAHREAAELYRVAVRFGERAAPGRADLFAALSYECYLTDQVEDAHAARLEAMELSAQAGDLRAVGAAQRWLSRLSWFLGRNDESERWASRAVATLEPLGEAAELAMAYSNVAQLRMLAGDAAETVRWGDRAIALARRLGDREVEMHALNNVGTALLTVDDSLDGVQRLARSLDMALADDAPEHAARAYTNLGSARVVNRRYAEADRDLRAGIAYCLEHDLDAWRLYMSSWLARSQAEQGHPAAAESIALEVLRRPRLSPITHICAAVVAGQVAAREGRPAEEHLGAALSLARATGEAQRLVPVAAGLAEAAWLRGDTDAIVAAVEHAWAAALAYPHPWDLGELSWWLTVAGVRRETPVPVAPPFALMLAGEWRRAAREWQALGCPLWTAHALAAAPDLDDARRALELVDSAAAPAVRLAMLRDRHARGLPVPRGPRPDSQGNAWGLTRRELEILGLLTDGLSNAELAQRLFLSEKTVGHHVSAILRKLGEPTRSRAVASALRNGIVAAR
jgi:ATP/maltotriose-dependent transcriptional regulator MalT